MTSVLLLQAQETLLQNVLLYTRYPLQVSNEFTIYIAHTHDVSVES